MKEKDIKNNWYYFCSLASQLQQTTQYVDHSTDRTNNIINGKTFSNEFAKILMLAASEFEVVSKSLCVEAGVTLNWNASIVSITRIIISKFPNIGNTEIYTPYQILQPLKSWKVITVPKGKGKPIDKVDGIDWWKAHNYVKHDRSKNFTSANLENCIYAMASLEVLELYLSQKVLGNIDAVSTIPCDYFDFEYGLSRLDVNAGHRLPDFP